MFHKVWWINKMKVKAAYINFEYQENFQETVTYILLYMYLKRDAHFNKLNNFQIIIKPLFCSLKLIEIIRRYFINDKYYFLCWFIYLFPYWWKRLQLQPYKYKPLQVRCNYMYLLRWVYVIPITFVIIVSQAC